MSITLHEKVESMNAQANQLIATAMLFFCVILLSGCSLGPSQSESAGINAADDPVVITDADSLDAHLDQTVTLRGKVRTGKVNTVLGVMFNGNAPRDQGIDGKTIEVTGKLIKSVHVYDDERPTQLASGTYYHLRGEGIPEEMRLRIIH